MGLSTFPAPSSGTSGLDINLAANVVPTMTGSVGRVTANLSVPAGTYLAYQSGLVGTTWTVNGVSVAVPTGQSSVISFTTTGSSFIVDYTPSTQLTWTNQAVTVASGAFYGADIPMIFDGTNYVAYTINISNFYPSVMYTSTNLSNWTRGSNLPDTTGTPRFLMYNTTATTYKYVAGNQDRIMVSTNGTTWGTGLVVNGPTGAYQATFSNTAAWKYVIATGAGTMAASTSGLTWTTRTFTSYGNPYAVGGGYDGSVFMWYGTKVNNDYSTSTDSVTWTGRSHQGIIGEITWCGFANSTYWSSGMDGVFSSTDAITWTLRSTSAKSISSITYKDSAYWAVDNFQVWGSGAKKIWKSTDGTTWVVVASTDKTVGLLNNGTALITWGGTEGLSTSTESGLKSKIYISSTGVGFVSSPGKVTLVPITSTPVTAS
jgi:hypothetical protein